MTEEWRDIPGYPGYQASSEGRIRSIDREVRSTDWTGQPYVCVRKGRILRPAVHGRCGHLSVDIVGTRLVHQLVAVTFIGPRPKGLVCAHNDGKSTNNKPSNLAYKTYHENNLDRIAHGGHRLSPDAIRRIRIAIATGESNKAIAAREDVGASAISSIKIGREYASIS